MKICSVCRRCFEDSVVSCAEADHGILTGLRAGNCEIVPNYRLEFLEDSSASGEIYRAQSEILKKTYLIKIIPRENFDENQKKQFLRETQALASIIHPNIARVFESGTLADGSLYAVTEFIGAQTLRECLTNVGAPSEVTALTISRQAADGLEAVHAVGVPHRGVKPENIILTTDAENRFLVKMQNFDFGAIHQAAVMTAPEQNINDLRYFSPEQCKGEEAEERSDVYSLGVVLYEALAGKVPFDAPYADALIKKQTTETAPSVKINNFDIRMLLTHTLTDALQKLTRLRLKSANAFARQLRHIEQLATHSSTPPPAVSYPVETTRKAPFFAPLPPKVETDEPIVIEESELLAADPVFAEYETFTETPDTEVIAEQTLSAEEIAAEETIPETAPENDLPVFSTQKLDLLFELVKAENAPEKQLPVEETPTVEERETFVFIDYTTTKLPPIETVLQNDSADKQAVFEEEKTEIHASKEPVLVEWQQPDDVPTVTQALGKKRKKIADAAFAASSETVVEKEVPALPAEKSEADDGFVTDIYGIRRDPSPVFSSDLSGRSWNLPETRKILTGAAILAFLAFAVGSVFLTRQSAHSESQTTAAQSSPVEKPPLKSVSTEKAPDAKTVAVSNPSAETNEANAPEIPDFQPRETDAKKSATVSTERQKIQRNVKESTANRETAEKSKSLSNEDLKAEKNVKTILNKKGNVEKSPSSSNKTEVFTRPRIVKNPSKPF